MRPDDIYKALIDPKVEIIAKKSKRDDDLNRPQANHELVDETKLFLILGVDVRGELDARDRAKDVHLSCRGVDDLVDCEGLSDDYHSTFKVPREHVGHHAGSAPRVFARVEWLRPWQHFEKKSNWKKGQISKSIFF